MVAYRTTQGGIYRTTQGAIQGCCCSSCDSCFDDFRLCQYVNVKLKNEGKGGAFWEGKGSCSTINIKYFLVEIDYTDEGGSTVGSCVGGGVYEYDDDDCTYSNPPDLCTICSYCDKKYEIEVGLSYGGSGTETWSLSQDKSGDWIGYGDTKKDIKMEISCLGAYYPTTYLLDVYYYYPKAKKIGKEKIVKGKGSLKEVWNTYGSGYGAEYETFVEFDGKTWTAKKKSGFTVEEDYGADGCLVSDGKSYYLVVPNDPGYVVGDACYGKKK